MNPVGHNLPALNTKLTSHDKAFFFYITVELQKNAGKLCWTREQHDWNKPQSVQDHQSWQNGDIIFQWIDLPHTSVVLLGNPSETRRKREDGITGEGIFKEKVRLPGICPFIWFCMWGAGGPPLTIPSEGMLWPWGGCGGGPLWFIPPGPMGMFWVGGYRHI